MGVQRGGRAIKEGGRDLGVRVGQEIPGGDCGAVAAPRGGGGDGADSGTELSAKGERARAERGGGGPLASGLGEGRELGQEGRGWAGQRALGWFWVSSFLFLFLLLFYFQPNKPR